METLPMGKVLVEAKVENLEDLYEVEKGLLQPDQVRQLLVKDALVDSGATLFSLPGRLIKQLGLRPVGKRPVRRSAGSVEKQIYGVVRLTIQGRDCRCEVMEVPDDCPVLIGQIPLEQVDFVVDPAGQRLIGNPAHGGDHVLELY